MMGSRQWQSPAGAPAAADAAEEDTGGVGGPSRRPLRHGLHRASPYGGGPRRWLPKVPVASRIFPTRPRDRAASDNDQEVHRESLEVIHERHSTEPNINAAAILPPTSVSNTFNLLLEGDRNPSHGNGLADIENIINQRYFSRDETLRLTEIMRSRTPDFSVEDQRPSVSTAKGFETSFSTPAKLIEDQPSLRTDIVPSSNVHDIGSSPIEIAKAFMEAQTSAFVHESKRRKFRALSHGVEADNSTSKVFPTITNDCSVCWPGSVVRGCPNYLTPQSNKGRTLPQPLSRTPYNRSVFRRSIKNSRHGDTYNGQTQFSTPFSIGSKTILEDKHASTSGGMVQPSSSRGERDGFGSIPREGSAAMKNVAFNLQGSDGKSMTENRAIFGCASGVDNISRGASVSVHPKSSETAFKILKQLDRTIPSPTSKPLGLRQTLANRNTSSVATNRQIKGPDFSIGNGNKQSSINESGSANSETTYGKKVQQPQSSPIAEESSEKVQRSGANSDVSEAGTSQQPLKSNLTPTSVAEVLDNKNTSKGFSFTFPIPKAPSSLLEPPPTPTMASPPRTLPITNEDIPTFTFGSPSTANKLVFSFNSTSSSLGAGATDPTFKFGSDNKRELVF
ncbi:unnamed protein product [Miscanthus lutarioriparius]|uniref:Uncharacterized protein n=1 Tax=Miscanthus lutarioriparius TaxID=422564 RepID=A0A811SEB7_9POAL|nr:unnamed protein product [Miscanthus lutarioriparius]